MSSISGTSPAKTRIGRLRCYVREMFPLHIRVPINLLNFGVIYFGLQAVARESVHVSLMGLVGAFSVQLLWFFIRVYDEFKDADSDLALARAGDPRFTNRPLVTGRVRLDDIAVLRWVMTAVIIAINVIFLNARLLAGLAIAMGYLTLSFKWFFWPPMKDRIMVVFFTHAPNILVISIYTAAVFLAEVPGRTVGWPGGALVVALWATGLAYEFSYKIRIPEDETLLNTYSKVLGRKFATIVTIVLTTTSAALTLYAAEVARMNPVTVVIEGAIAAYAVGGCLAFLFWPTRERAKLTKYIGLYWYVSCFAFIAGSISLR